MGSLVLSVPLLRSIKQTYPAAHLTFLTFSQNEKILSFLPYIDRVFSIRTSLFSLLWDTLKVVFQMRRMQVDIFIDLEFFARYATLLSFFSGAKTRVGFHTSSLVGRGKLLTHRVYWNPARHAAENFLALGGVIGIQREADSPLHLGILPIAQSTSKDALKWMSEHGLFRGRYFLCNPCGNTLTHLNSYPIEGWRELAELLHQYTGYQIVLIGLSDRSNHKMAQLHNKHIHNFINRTTFQQLLALIQNTACVIGVDSGISHLAAAFQVPSLTFFGPDSPHAFGPLNPKGDVLYRSLHCSPCVNILEGKVSDCKNNLCIKSWTPAQVALKALDLLKRQNRLVTVEKQRCAQQILQTAPIN